MQGADREDAEHHFPELKESEDERIRKELIKGFQHYDRESKWGKFTTTEILSWLEKQGENSACKIKIGETYKCIASPKYTYFRTGDIYHVEDNFVAELINTCSDCFVPLEKQGEQKHKIQPKFKIGDIIRFKGNETLKGEAETHKIVSYDNELYVFDNGTTDLFSEQNLYELVEQNSPWSEEDEARYWSCLRRLGTGNLRQPETINSKWFKEHIVRQPDWKPSEYDISVLEEIARNIRNNIRPFCSEVSALEDLIENLEKL